MKKYLALFDLDGTLFDTGEVNYFSYRDALKPFGINFDREYYAMECNGRHYTEFLPYVMGSDKHIEKVHKAKKEMYVKNLDKARENVQLFRMARVMKELYHLAVVTTASRKNAIDILSYFGHGDLFEYIISQEDITKIKPDPQGFILAMQYFGIGPENTVIFEDSKVGIQAARATGASVIVINRF